MTHDEFIALARGLLKHPAEIISWRRLTATPGLDASAIHGRLGAQVALLQSPILPAAGSLYPVKEIFCNVPVDKPHTRVSRFSFPRFKLTPSKCPVAWHHYGKREWDKERNRALHAFCGFFPFLPKAEQPINWPAKG